MEYTYLSVEKKDGIAYVTINRSNMLNALNTDVFCELNTAFTKINDDSEVQVTILTGEGRAFVAGADITQLGFCDVQSARAMSIQAQRTMELIETIDKPVIAAVNGFALGGGNELAMACDIRIASEKAKFGQPEVGLGIIPCFGGTQRLPRLVGKGEAKYLIMSGEMIDAQEAYRIGLVQKVVPAEELIPACEKLAKTIMSKAPIAVKMAKHCINNGLNTDLKTGTNYESEAYVVTYATEDRVAGMKAFVEKGVAEFHNH